MISKAPVVQTRTHQEGVALAIALILLAVIGLSSVTAMQSGLFGTMVSNNLRSNQLAVHAAEMALRFCERGVQLTPPAVAIQPLPLVNTDRPTAWTNLANWGAAGITVTIPANVLNSPMSGTRYVQPPQCLVETLELRPGNSTLDESVFLITARGFSPDYRAAGANILNGSEVWLQSTVRFTR